MGSEIGNYNWKDLSSIPKEHMVPHFPLKESNGLPRIVMPEDVHEEGMRLWETALIAQFVGRIPNFSAFQKAINLMWGDGKEFELRPAGKNLFVIVFDN
ncbi:hypothetical protein PTKIN_Ptkin03bG0188800 [Pterospermum kingtungense]